MRFDDGDAEISCKSQYGRCCNLLFDQTCLGFELLEEMYPDNVKLTRLGVENGEANTVS